MRVACESLPMRRMRRCADGMAPMQIEAMQMAARPAGEKHPEETSSLHCCSIVSGFRSKRILDPMPPAILAGFVGDASFFQPSSSYWKATMKRSISVAPVLSCAVVALLLSGTLSHAFVPQPTACQTSTSQLSRASAACSGRSTSQLFSSASASLPEGLSKTVVKPGSGREADAEEKS